MIDATALLLVYYYDYEDRYRPVVKDIVARYSGNVYNPFPIYLYEPLTKIFSKVIVYDYLKRAAEIGHKAMNREIIELVRRERPRYVIWTSYYYDVFQETLNAIRKMGSIVIGWYFDDEWRFDSYSKYWVPYLDFSVTGSIETVSKYKALNARVIHTIPNTGTALYPDWSQIKGNYSVSFVGTRFYADRPKWFEEVKKLNIPISAFGTGWTGYVSFEKMLEIFQTSKINLNFSGGGPHGDEKQIKGRVFQICMAGGFLLTEYTPGLEKYFVLDKEVVCFRTPKEMAAKIVYYLNHDEERRSIARAGWERATREYTSTAMMAKVFEEIEEANRTGLKPSPIKLRLPLKAHGQISGYYLDWALAFWNERGSGLWKGALWMMLRHYPFAIPVEWWGASLIRFLPLPLQNIIRKLYRLARRGLKTIGGKKPGQSVPTLDA
jgi:spore maturation protein CgeB